MKRRNKTPVDLRRAARDLLNEPMFSGRVFVYRTGDDVYVTREFQENMYKVNPDDVLLRYSDADLLDPEKVLGIVDKLAMMLSIQSIRADYADTLVRSLDASRARAVNALKANAKERAKEILAQLDEGDKVIIVARERQELGKKAASERTIQRVKAKRARNI
jgi:hypothetical protein